MVKIDKTLYIYLIITLVLSLKYNAKLQVDKDITIIFINNIDIKTKDIIKL